MNNISIIMENESFSILKNGLKIVEGAKYKELKKHSLNKASVAIESLLPECSDNTQYVEYTGEYLIDTDTGCVYNVRGGPYNERFKKKTQCGQLDKYASGQLKVLKYTRDLSSCFKDLIFSDEKILKNFQKDPDVRANVFTTVLMNIVAKTPEDITTKEILDGIKDYFGITDQTEIQEMNKKQFLVKCFCDVTEKFDGDKNFRSSLSIAYQRNGIDILAICDELDNYADIELSDKECEGEYSNEDCDTNSL